MSTITVEVPEELVRLGQESGQAPSQTIARLAVLELFRERKISMGRAAELAGLGVGEFMSFSAARGVDWNYTGEDLEQDRDTLVRLGL